MTFFGEVRCDVLVLQSRRNGASLLTAEFKLDPNIIVKGLTTDGDESKDSVDLKHVTCAPRIAAACPVYPNTQSTCPFVTQVD